MNYKAALAASLGVILFVIEARAPSELNHVEQQQVQEEPVLSSAISTTTLSGGATTIWFNPIKVPSLK
jgi:hypothetical protein